MPLRAINTAGKWRIVVNGVKAHYETLTQVQRSSKTKTKLKVRYGQTKRKTKVIMLSKIFSLTLNIFSDGSSGGVLNPWISVPSCSRLLRYQLRPGGTKTTLHPFKGIWRNAKCRPCWIWFFSLPQKSLYHRFLVYDPYDKYFPFAIETFKLPASCACYNGAYIESHWFVLVNSPTYSGRSLSFHFVFPFFSHVDFPLYPFSLLNSGMYLIFTVMNMPISTKITTITTIMGNDNLVPP